MFVLEVGISQKSVFRIQVKLYIRPQTDFIKMPSPPYENVFVLECQLPIATYLQESSFSLILSKLRNHRTGSDDITCCSPYRIHGSYSSVSIFRIVGVDYITVFTAPGLLLCSVYCLILTNICFH